ncbi:Nitrogen assimilation transcription factor nit-4-like protein 7 [Colletotrichum chlorophyti]|uniref:Nitrogen assimilation transcription factor nit-4-like protein 7 n=1 Tax=Colletotrichum chlorophyti TaxID=708187 RepID=A0A1Q8S6B0_9PEZI|nr:Nitrogen assimilation transcription factor nit-4-like protein 7 [Colletotrichum chlorophyti]
MSLVFCTGTRPTCSRCALQSLQCEWDTAPDTTRAESLRRRNEFLEHENEDLRELIRFLSQRPEDEAMEIFRRLRQTGDAFRVLELVRVGDLLLGKQKGKYEKSSTVDDLVDSYTASGNSGSTPRRLNESPKDS